MTGKNKVYYFSEDITAESVSKLLTFSNNNEGSITIYFTSSGGGVYSANVLIDYFNKNINRIELIAAGYIDSSAFKVFFKSRCKKSIIRPTTGMIHLPSLEVDLNSNQKYVFKSHKYELESIQGAIEEEFEFYKSIGITDKEIGKIKKGENVYFDYDRMLEFLNKSRSAA